MGPHVVIAERPPQMFEVGDVLMVAEIDLPSEPLGVEAQQMPLGPTLAPNTADAAPTTASISPERAATNSVRWLQANEAFPSIAEQARVQKRRFLGSVAIRGERGSAQINRDTAPNESTLLMAIQLAAFGDEQSEQVVRTNVATDIAERLFKAAHQTQVSLSMVDGRLQQSGRTMRDLHRNTLQETVLVPEMVRRSSHELGNIMLFEALHAAGIMEQFDMAVFSPTSTTMSQEVKDEYRFYTATETCSVQLLSAEGDQVTLGTALVAGKATPTSERHDISAIRKLAAKRGIVLDTTDGTEMIGQALLIPKGETTGVETLVQWFDDESGGTFYGQQKPRHNYQEYARERLKLATQFEDMVTEVTEQLKDQAASFTKPMDAILWLDKLSAAACVRRAVADTSLDTRVFGEKAALEIEQARFFAERGNAERAEASIRQAIKLDTSGSCPIRLRDIENDDPSLPFQSNEENESSETGKKKHGKCPYCKAKVYIDPCAKRIECWDCHAKVVNKVVVSKGDGGSQARAKAASTNAQAPKEKTPTSEAHASHKILPVMVLLGRAALVPAESPASSPA